MFKFQHELSNGRWWDSGTYPGERDISKEKAELKAARFTRKHGFKYRAVDTGTPEPVQAPLAKQPHYAQRKPEPIEVIEAWKLNYNLGCAMKYMGRAGLKGTEADHIKDLEKAISYLRREINTLLGSPSWEESKKGA